MQIEKKDFKKLLKEANEALEKNNIIQAKKLFEKIILINPDIAGIHNNLGIINLNEGNIDISINYFKKAIELNPKISISYSNLGLAFSKIKKNTQAINNYIKAIEIDPKNFNACYNLGNLYRKQNNIQKAEKYLFQVIEIKPKMLSAYNNLFELYDRSNQVSKLQNILDKAQLNLGSNPLIDFFKGIIEFKNKNYKQAIKNLENIKLNEKDFNRLIIKEDILAKSYDFLGEYDKAFKYFARANNLFNSYYKSRINKNFYLNLIKKRTNYFSNIKKINWRSIEIDDEFRDPIFLVGFPRSGTTLLDSILASHFSIEVLEEKPIVDKFIVELENKIGGDFSKLENIDNNLFHSMRKFYFNSREKYFNSKESKIIIDKLPLNIVYSAEIFRFFPKAKFIFVLRNPYDSVLSCFMQQFAPNSAMLNLTNLRDAANLYDLVMNLWLKYLNNFKIKNFTIKYEDIINDFEPKINNLLNFLSLEWSDEVKKFNKNLKKRGIIDTPSYDQVNLPLYTRSIGRWKNYKDKFLHEKQVLDKWVKNFKY